MNLRKPLSGFVANLVTLEKCHAGNSLIETALVLPVLLLMLAGAVDIGRAFRAGMVVNAAARTGAAYGIHHPADVAGMLLAAQTDSSSLVTVVPTATYGCECSDGSNAIASCTSEPSCSMNSVYYVELDTSATYTPIVPWPGLPSTMLIKAKVRLRAAR